MTGNFLKFFKMVYRLKDSPGFMIRTMYFLTDIWNFATLPGM
jgi:hypothetical protein